MPHTEPASLRSVARGISYLGQSVAAAGTEKGRVRHCLFMRELTRFVNERRSQSSSMVTRSTARLDMSRIKLLGTAGSSAFHNAWYSEPQQISRKVHEFFT